MIILITGGTHTGKTALAQRLLEKYRCPYLSIDHLKMGLIRSGCCSLTPESDDDELTAYLWPIVREIVKTCIENKQNLIVEGCYIPFTYANDFSEQYLEKIRYVCLIFSRDYIDNHFEAIRRFANIAENRFDNNFITKDLLITEYAVNLDLCNKLALNYLLIDNKYVIDLNAIDFGDAYAN